MTLTDNVLKRLQAELINTMIEETEPFVQAAMKGLEQKMRAALAAQLIARIDAQYSVERRGTDIVITVRGKP